jgi:hypothetical protein
MLHPDDLLRLARHYGAAMGLTLGAIGRRACNNRLIFEHIKDGRATIRTLERIEAFLRAEWPDSVPWPIDIYPPRGRRAAPKPCTATSGDAAE